jgi:stage V sporulation protein AD
MPKKVGNQTLLMQNDVCISSYAAVVGAKEGEGPLGTEFDKVFNDELVGEDSFEKAESRLQTTAVQTAIEKSGIQENEIEYLFAGDLLNQCIGSAYGLRDFSTPFIGLYGACSTMAPSMYSASRYSSSWCLSSCAESMSV